jgi:hypothetical protein
MGDRGNILVIENEIKEVGVFLYSHWDGSELPQTLQTTLKRRSHWDDPQYLARIIFNEMTAEEDAAGDTGYGISATLWDNEHPILTVNPKTKRVGIADEKTPFEPKQEWSFENFCDLENPNKIFE